jgi:hypothetical protein
MFELFTYCSGWLFNGVAAKNAHRVTFEYKRCFGMAQRSSNQQYLAFAQSNECSTYRRTPKRAV